MIKIAIDEILKKKDKTKYWLSQQTGITQTNLGKLVNNQTNSIKFENLEVICNVLNCTPNDILKIVKNPTSIKED